jgi:cyclic pyranopterin phosphate synthase
VSLTTNGFNLSQKAQLLYEAGLRRINISFDSLNPETFRLITGRDRWRQVWAGIQVAHQVGFDPLKLNVVVIPGLNESEVEDLAALTLERQWHVRFIEFMPIGNAALFQQAGWVESEVLRQRIRARFGLEPGFVAGNGPADVFRIPGAKGTLGFISQMSECFCNRCNRMRLSSDGWLRPCLLNESGQINLRDPLRAGIPAERLRQQVRELLDIKPDINFKGRDTGSQGSYRRTMSQIGG